MCSMYSLNGTFLGTLVENLTDGPTNELDGEPLGTIGEIKPSHGVDEFQRNVQDSVKHWGTRRVYHIKFGSILQALVRDITGGLSWINI